MEVTSVTVFQVFLIVATAGGAHNNDLVSLLDPETYFKSREIAVKATGLADLTGKVPADGKAQIGQLLAIRWMGEHSDEVKKDKQIRALLEAIAEGAKAQDPQGFAKEYARRALARIDGKPPPLSRAPENSVRGDSLKWFPQQVTFLGAMDFRAGADFKGGTLTPPSTFLNKVLPIKAWDKMFKFADRVGNIQIDRATLVFSQDGKDRQDSRIYMRYTGRCDRQRVVDVLRELIPGIGIKEEKSAKGELITLLSIENSAPAFALVGDTDLVVAGFEGNQKNHMEVVQEILAVRAGTKPGVDKGSLGAELKTMPARATALMVGELPENLARDLAAGGLVKALPSRVAADLTMGKDLVLHFRGTMTNADDAKAFSESVAQFKQQGREFLKNPPAELKLKPEAVKMLGQVLDSIKIEAKDAAVSGNLELSIATVQALVEMLEEVLKTIAPG